MSGYAAIVCGLWCIAIPDVDAAGTSFDGRVVRVLDGDSLVLRVGRQDLQVRLARIDAPEWNQPHGRIARRVLAEWVLHKQVHAELVDIDAYHRSVVELFVGSRNVNREMVRNGHAWAYTFFGASPVVIELEREARAQRVGLWKLPADQRRTPFQWREAHRRSKPHE